MHFSYVRDRAALQLPAAAVAGALNHALESRGAAVVTAPPGSGKSTLLPLTLLAGVSARAAASAGAAASGGKILMLEPRRLAARQIALRLASLSGSPIGELVGYRMRFETRVSAATRIEVLTEGILTRMLVSDPTLEGVAVVVFDEFHERSLASDTALALVREAQRLVRPDLKIVIMSATLDAASLCESLDAELLQAEGELFPVRVLRAGVEADEANVAEAVAHVIREAHKANEGDILAFLPGEGEIRRCAERLGDALAPTRVYPLYGLLPPKEQQEAIAPSPAGSRKVVLATPIAETSLTIEGVRVVVDGGLCRQPVYDPRSGLSTLQTVRISRDMATQRTGRAGRVAPGVCYRLWSAATEARMAECRQPEILQADLAGVVLDLAAWGASDPSSLPWLTPPPAASLSAAFSLLRELGALDGSLQITRVGRAMAALPCHPRIAHMLVRASDASQKALACDIAALLEEKDPLAGTAAGDSAVGPATAATRVGPSSNSADLCLRLSALRGVRSRGGARGVWNRLVRIAEQYRRLVRVPADDSEPDPFDVGALLAAAYPERVAKAVEGAFGVYALASGERAAIDGSDALAAYDWLSVASVFVRPGAPGRIFLAAPLSPEVLPSLAVPYDNIAWDARKGVLVARRERRIGTLTVSSQPLGAESREAALQVLCEAARKEGASMFDWSEAVQRLSRRIATVAAWHPELGLPEVDAEAVFSRAWEWLPALSPRATTAAELRKIDLCPVLWGLLSYEQQRAVDRLAPSHIEVPTGSHITVEYRQGAELPVLRVRLQECFGLLDTPRVDDGRRPVLMELLSPGFKPVQLTTDLASFWRDTYFEVRKELRRRYPKHAWPDDPLAAAPVRGVRRK